MCAACLPPITYRLDLTYQKHLHLSGLRYGEAEGEAEGKGKKEGVGAALSGECGLSCLQSALFQGGTSYQALASDL